ncbi:uncharacterized protein BDV17DRAFT_288412 [Aspergillus undulatus]|uniref:uncharacterized protein n=1 Tax=Aspergillus undulatus TaxID=1810928 RepID=UPI003CCC9825
MSSHLSKASRRSSSSRVRDDKDIIYPDDSSSQVSIGSWRSSASKSHRHRDSDSMVSRASSRRSKRDDSDSDSGVSRATSRRSSKSRSYSPNSITSSASSDRRTKLSRRGSSSRLSDISELSGTTVTPSNTDDSRSRMSKAASRISKWGAMVRRPSSDEEDENKSMFSGVSKSSKAPSEIRRMSNGDTVTIISRAPRSVSRKSSISPRGSGYGAFVRGARFGIDDDDGMSALSSKDDWETLPPYIAGPSVPRDSTAKDATTKRSRHHDSSSHVSSSSEKSKYEETLPPYETSSRLSKSTALKDSTTKRSKHPDSSSQISIGYRRPKYDQDVIYPGDSASQISRAPSHKSSTSHRPKTRREDSASTMSRSSTSRNSRTWSDRLSDISESSAATIKPKSSSSGFKSSRRPSPDSTVSRTSSRTSGSSSSTSRRRYDDGRSMVSGSSATRRGSGYGALMHGARRPSEGSIVSRTSSRLSDASGRSGYDDNRSMRFLGDVKLHPPIRLQRKRPYNDEVFNPRLYPGNNNPSARSVSGGSMVSRAPYMTSDRPQSQLSGNMGTMTLAPADPTATMAPAAPPPTVNNVTIVVVKNSS